MATMKRIPAPVLKLIAEDVRMAARDNARHTEGVTDSYDEGPGFYAMFIASAQSIRDDIQGRAYDDYASRMVGRPLTTDEANKVYKLATADR